MTSRERVRRAVHFQQPDKTPLFYFNAYTERSDILNVGYRPSADFRPVDDSQSEWGFCWHRIDGTMGQPVNPPIDDLCKLASYKPPCGKEPARFLHLAADRERFLDKYLIGALGISGMNLASFLRGFEAYLTDLYEFPEEAVRLLDMVIDFETDVIRGYGAQGLDAVGFADDLGMQASLIVSPQMFRDILKPRYKKQFDLAHSLGMDVYFHSCGDISAILPDLLEIGVDILNLNQPDIFGIEVLASQYAGKVCFNCPVDHQTVAITGSDAEIADYVRRLQAGFGGGDGGFIGYIEEYGSVGMSDANFASILRAFEGL